MHVLTIVLPIFALIAVGYMSARVGYLSETAQKGLNEFTFNLAMPALLFRTIASTGAVLEAPVRLWLAYFGTVALLWVAATLATRLLLRRPATDSAAIAMTTVYGNVVMIGIPLCFALLGDKAAAPLAVILSIHTPILWFAGILHHQWSASDAGRHPLTVAGELLSALARNPLIIAILAGGLWRMTGLGITPSLDNVLKLLGQAGIPCALVVLGASLVRFAIKGQTGTLSTLLVLKLVVMPAVAWLIAVHWLALPHAAATVAVIFAATPAGANAYLFAERMGRVVNSTSGAVALGTLISAITITALVSMIEVIIPR